MINISYFSSWNVVANERIQILARILGQWWFKSFQLSNDSEKDTFENENDSKIDFLVISSGKKCSYCYTNFIVH